MIRPATWQSCPTQPAVLWQEGQRLLRGWSSPTRTRHNQPPQATGISVGTRALDGKPTARPQLTPSLSLKTGVPRARLPRLKDTTAHLKTPDSLPSARPALSHLLLMCSVQGPRTKQNPLDSRPHSRHAGSASGPRAHPPPACGPSGTLGGLD